MCAAAQLVEETTIKGARPSRLQRRYWAVLRLLMRLLYLGGSAAAEDAVF
jgi:hypothetical protein